MSSSFVRYCIHAGRRKNKVFAMEWKININRNLKPLGARAVCNVIAARAGVGRLVACKHTRRHSSRRDRRKKILKVASPLYSPSRLPRCRTPSVFRSPAFAAWRGLAWLGHRPEYPPLENRNNRVVVYETRGYNVASRDVVGVFRDGTVS